MTGGKEYPVALALRADALLWTVPHVAREASRPVLCHLVLEPGGVLAATNGHTLAAARDGHSAQERMILSGNWIKFMAAVREQRKANLKASRRRVDVGDWVTLEKVVDGTYKIGSVLVKVTHAGERDYPQWRQVAPTPDRHAELSTIGLNAEYLGRFGKAAGQLKSTPNCLLHFTAENRAVVVTVPGRPDVWGLVMPCEPKMEAAPFAPEWVTGLAERVERAA
jgi:hypothetical protein